MSHSEVVSALLAFTEERNWDQFHTPENLAKSICIEASELLECFQWAAEPEVDRVSHELADVLTYCFLIANKLNLDIDQIVMDKLEISKGKYPVEKARGRSAKYDQL